MNFKNMPEEMKALKQWTCYKRVLDKESGKFDKFIVSSVTGKAARCNEPETWTNFQSAKRYCFNRYYHGLAFTLVEGITFIDIDHVRDKQTGEILSNEAKEFIELLLDTFTETSLSGTGVHILIRGNLPADALKRNDKKGLEFYSTKRFVCMTGNLLNNSLELKDYSDKIAELKAFKR